MAKITTAPFQPDTHPSIVASCAALDTILTTPRWDELIDLQTFDINLVDACVMGQTGRFGWRSGVIPDDGTVPWYDYGDGVQYVAFWLDEHPTAAEAIGANSDMIRAAFDAHLNDDDGEMGAILQNYLWRAWITYRQQQREFEQSGYYYYYYTES